MTIDQNASRGSRWEWARATLLAANLAWTTLCLGGFLPETMVVTSALTALLVGVHFVGCASENTRTHPAGWMLVPFVAYAAANVVWVTPVPWLGWFDWFGWAQMTIAFWVVLNGLRSPAPRLMLFSVLVALGVVAVVMGSYQRFVRPDWLMLGRVQSVYLLGRASGPFGIPNSLAAFLLLLLPALGALTFRRGAGATERVLFGWLTAVLGFGLVLTISRGGAVGLALALTVWPLVAKRRRSWRRRILRTAAVLAVVILAGWTLYSASPKIRDRVVTALRDAGEKTRPIMWLAAWELFREHPAWGTGGGSYNVMFEKHRPERFPDEPLWAHNDYLNTLSDYGLFGFTLFFGAVGAIAGRCFFRRREERAASAGGWIDGRAFGSALGIGIMAFGFHLWVDFHLKIPALALAFATVAALGVGCAWPLAIDSGVRSVTQKWSLYMVGAVGAAGIAFGFIPSYHGEAVRSQARQAIDRLAIASPSPASFRADLSAARAGLARAVAIAPKNGQARSDLAYAIALWAHVEPHRIEKLGREAEVAAEQALAISRVNAEVWLRRGVARDMQGRWLQAGNDFTQAIAIAPRNALTWYHYADHLSRKENERGTAEAALAFCLRLDPGNRPGLALRHRLAISARAP